MSLEPGLADLTWGIVLSLDFTLTKFLTSLLYSVDTVIQVTELMVSNTFPESLWKLYLPTYTTGKSKGEKIVCGKDTVYKEAYSADPDFRAIHETGWLELLPSFSSKSRIPACS